MLMLLNINKYEYVIFFSHWVKMLKLKTALVKSLILLLLKFFVYIFTKENNKFNIEFD